MGLGLGLGSGFRVGVRVRVRVGVGVRVMVKEPRRVPPMSVSVSKLMAIVSPLPSAALTPG